MRYPKPDHPTIIEPFAGAAGYSTRHHEKMVLLVEKYPVLAELWRYLITAPTSDTRSIPLVESLKDLPPWVSDGARFLVGMWLGTGDAAPRRNLSAGNRRRLESGSRYAGWTAEVRERVASQQSLIRHWQILEGDYTVAPEDTATWFIDPPYNNRAGSAYVHHTLDYDALADWCKRRAGQVIVCENEGATWLPFVPFETFRQSINGSGSREALYQQ